MLLHQVQLPSYNYAKSQLVQHIGMNPDGLGTFLASSAISGVCVVSGDNI